MREDILQGNYRDPFEIDTFGQNSLDDFADNVYDLGLELNEGAESKYIRKRKSILENPHEDQIRRFVKVETGPWTKDQAFFWPNAEADAFEDFLQDIKQNSGGNTGYLNQALLQKLKDHYGQIAIDSIPKRYLKKDKQSLKERYSQRVLNSASTSELLRF